jgi:hypothetical protein
MLSLKFVSLFVFHVDQGSNCARMRMDRSRMSRLQECVTWVWLKPIEPLLKGSIAVASLAVVQGHGWYCW